MTEQEILDEAERIKQRRIRDAVVDKVNPIGTLEVKTMPGPVDDPRYFWEFGQYEITVTVVSGDKPVTVKALIPARDLKIS